MSGPRTDDPSLAQLAGDGFPVVLQGCMPGLDVPSIDIDNVAAAAAAVDHLLSLGHRRIALHHQCAAVLHRGRANGCAATGRRSRPPASNYDEALVEEGAFDAASGERAAKGPARADHLLRALFVASDVLALGAINALREANRRVPDDVSVVGFDDIALAPYLDPPLTTVRLPAFELGQAAGRVLLDRIAN